MEKFIHIKADSEIYSVNELCPEKHAVRRLTTIRNNFQKLSTRPSMPDAKLIVKTCVNNPELPFLTQ